MPKKATKKKVRKSSEKERHSGIILEDIDSKLQQLLEGYEMHDTKIDRLYQKIEGVNNKLENFVIETRSNFNTVFEYLSRIDDELQDIKKEITDLKSRLDKKADLDRLLKLEDRVKQVEMILAKTKLKTA